MNKHYGLIIVARIFLSHIMKKLFTAIYLFIAITNYAYSQDTIIKPSASFVGNFKHHISVGYSWNLFNHLLVGLTAISDLYDYSNKSYFYKYKENGKYDFIKSKAIHTVVIDYHQRLSRYPKGTFGFTTTYDFYRDYMNYNLNDTLINMTETTQAFSVMGNGYFHYLKKSKIIGLKFWWRYRIYDYFWQIKRYRKWHYRKKYKYYSYGQLYTIWHRTQNKGFSLLTSKHRQ